MMKKYIHLSACLLSTSMLLAHPPRLQSPEEQPKDIQETTQDEKTGRIIASIGNLFQGVISLVHSIKNHEKPGIIGDVGHLVNGIMQVAATATTKGSPCPDDVDRLKLLVHNAVKQIGPSLQQRVRCEAHALHDYLSKTPLEEIQATLATREGEELAQDAVENEEVIAQLDQDDQELNEGVLTSLYEMVQDLFAIIQDPENPQVVGQSIADMLASIMNIATQALKYEYLTSKDADTNVALYLESFSSELTKEIKHLMLQTALSVRNDGCCTVKQPAQPEQPEVTRKSCCDKCTSCSSGKSCGCCNSCGKKSTEVTRKSCCSCNNSCSKPCNSCNNCKSCCGCHRRNEEVEQAEATDEQAKEEEAKVKSCSSCGCKPSGSGCCNCNRNEDTEQAEATDEQAKQEDAQVKSCSSCGCKPSGSGCCNCNRNEDPEQAEATDEQAKEEDAQVKSCSSCGCKPSGSGCCNCNRNEDPKQAETTDEQAKEEDAQVKSCSHCGCTSSTSGCCNNCGKKSGEVEQAEAKEEQAKQEEAEVKCPCNKPKEAEPKVEAKKCNCGNELTRPPKPNHHPKVARLAARLVYPEGYAERHRTTRCNVCDSCK